MTAHEATPPAPTHWAVRSPRWQRIIMGVAFVVAPLVWLAGFLFIATFGAILTVIPGFEGRRMTSNDPRIDWLVVDTVVAPDGEWTFSRAIDPDDGREGLRLSFRPAIRNVPSSERQMWVQAPRVGPRNYRRIRDEMIAECRASRP